jgi:hypothetical protein
MQAMPDDRIPPELALDVEPFDLDQLDRAVEDTPDPVAAWADDDPDDYEPDKAAVMRWHITDDEGAEWAMSHVNGIYANAQALADQRDAYIARINRHHAEAMKRLDARRRFFEQHLILYAAQYRARDPKRNKTLHLPSGVVRSTETQAKVAVADDVTVADWALSHLEGDQHEAVVKTTTKVMLGELRKVAVVGQRVWGHVLDLSCGHSVRIALATEDGEKLDLRDGYPCRECADPLDGEPVREVVRVEDLTERVVRSKDTGEVIPGTRIEPGALTFTVSPK